MGGREDLARDPAAPPACNDGLEYAALIDAGGRETPITGAMIDRACEILVTAGPGRGRPGVQTAYRCWFEEREAAESPLDEEDDGIDGLDLG